MTVLQWVFQNEVIAQQKSDEIANGVYRDISLTESIASIVDGLVPVIIEGTKEQIDARLDIYQDMREKRSERNETLISIVNGEDVDNLSTEGSNNIKDDDIGDTPVKKSKVVDDNIDYTDPEAVKAYMEEVYDPIPNVISVPKNVLAEREFVVDTFRRDELKQELRFQQDDDKKDTPGGGKFILRKRETIGSKPKTGKAGIFLDEEGDQNG